MGEEREREREMLGTLILSLISAGREKKGTGCIVTILTEWIVDVTCAGLRASGWLAVVFEVQEGIGGEPDN